jgi:hypothetical protein
VPLVKSLTKASTWAMPSWPLAVTGTWVFSSSAPVRGFTTKKKALPLGVL